MTPGDSDISRATGTEDPYHLEEAARIELTLGNNSKQLSSYIKDLPNNLEWIIDNPEILSIKDNIIVPKKIGETKIQATKDGVTYTINVKITNLVNPKTVTETLIIVILVIYLLLGTTILKKKKVRIN